jgi:peptidoglycan/LPS O-acetylase OafA/YrhL
MGNSIKLTQETSVILDFIRGISAQLVLVGHLLSFYGIYGVEGQPGIFNIQNFGVTIFFILSGFLIAYSVQNKGMGYGFRNYFVDRFSRIYIAFIPALILIGLLDVISALINSAYTFGQYVTVKQFLGNVFMLQDFPIQPYLRKIPGLEVFNITSFGSGRPLWTVAIEWWMYLFFGFLIYKKITFRNVLLLIIFLIVPFFNLDGRGSGLSLVWFAGAFIFYQIKSSNHRIKNPGILMFLFLLGAMARLFFNGFEVYDIGFYLPLAGVFFLLVKKLQQNRGSYGFIRRLKGFAGFLASFSFSLYLLHYTIIVFIINLNLHLNKWVEIGIGFVLSNLISYLFAGATEFKYLQLRNKIKGKFFSGSSEPNRVKAKAI